MNDLDKHLLKIINEELSKKNTAYNIRKNGKSIERECTDDIKIVSKTDVSGIDIYVNANTKNGYVHIPVLLTQSGLSDKVYNDFHIGKNANVVINAGCGIHNDAHKDSEHDGIHRFFLEEGATVKYIEKHYGEGEGTGKRILNPTTEVYLKKGSSLEMDTAQIKGVSSTVRRTKGVLKDNTTLVITERIMTHDNQIAKTIFDVKLNGKNSSAKVTSRSVATDNSKQSFVSKVIGNNDCFGHVECDAIIQDNAQVTSDPKIVANNIDARLIHEATIGKIAGDQLMKLMTLGLSEKKAEETIIKGFLK
ncbi:MAG: SufD family Fe-S cluster assembly protein [Bacilli bacterium]|nr:SufD family Fe-S cluster assembly protein [Bacilli bacterium]